MLFSRSTKTTAARTVSPFNGNSSRVCQKGRTGAEEPNSNSTVGFTPGGPSASGSEDSQRFEKVRERAPSNADGQLVYTESSKTMAEGPVDGVPVGDITLALSRLRNGDESAAEDLMALAYDAFRRCAARQLSRERCGHTLQSSDLAHETYLKIIDSAIPKCRNRKQFFKAGARAMRCILIDYARMRERKNAAQILKWPSWTNFSWLRQQNAISLLLWTMLWFVLKK